MSGSVSTANSPAQQAANAAAANQAIRQFITKNCPMDCVQLMASTILAGGAAQGAVVNVVPRMVGLVTGFLVRVDMDIVVPAGITLTRTPFGPSNILGKLEFVDLNNLTRISTAGWHLALLNSARTRRVVGAAFASDSPLGFGNNNDHGITCPAQIAGGTTQRVSMVYHVPLAYSPDDLRGAIYANIVNATMALNLYFNAAPIAAAGADPTLAVYSSSGAANGVQTQNAKVTVYQEFYDQLPVNPNGVALPQQDLTTSYQLKNTTLVGLTAGQDFPIPFSNFASFLSTSVVFDNGGSLNPYNDVNYWALETASAALQWKVEPWVTAYRTRNMLQDDPPLATYYFDHRRRPINTLQYGNIQLLLNPSQVNAGAALLVGFEQFVQQGVVNLSGSLPGG